MTVKAVEMVRAIRDRHYEETKDLSIDEQIEFVQKKAKALQTLKSDSQRLPGSIEDKNPISGHLRT